MSARPLLDHYREIAPQRSTARALVTDMQQATGRAQAVARRLLIDKHRAEYDALYQAVLTEVLA